MMPSLLAFEHVRSSVLCLLQQPLSAAATPLLQRPWSENLLPCSSSSRLPGFVPLASWHLPAARCECPFLLQISSSSLPFLSCPWQMTAFSGSLEHWSDSPHAPVSSLRAISKSLSVRSPGQPISESLLQVTAIGVVEIVVDFMSKTISEKFNEPLVILLHYQNASIDPLSYRSVLFKECQAQFIHLGNNMKGDLTKFKYFLPSSCLL